MSDKTDAAGLEGYGVAELYDAQGNLKQRVEFKNLITDSGDLYLAQKAIVAIAPANATAPTAVTGMKLGTGSTAAAKNGAGAALVTNNDSAGSGALLSPGDCQRVRADSRDAHDLSVARIRLAVRWPDRGVERGSRKP